VLKEAKAAAGGAMTRSWDEESETKALSLRHREETAEIAAV